MGAVQVHPQTPVLCAWRAGLQAQHTYLSRVAPWLLLPEPKPTAGENPGDGA